MKKKKIFYFVFIIVLIFTISCLLFSNYALANEGIKVNPLRFEELVDPGEILHKSIKITNNSLNSKTMFAYIMDFTAADETGKAKLIKPGSEQGTFLSSWIDITKEGIDFSANEEKEIFFTIKVPENTGPGGYYGAIIFGTKAPETRSNSEEKGAVISIAHKTGVLLLFQVSGDIVEKAVIKEFSTDKEFYSTPFTVNFLTRVENLSNVHIKPRGTIVISNMLGKETSIIRVNEKGSNILPNSIRRFESSWQNNFGFGKYKALLALSYGTPTKLGGQGKQSITFVKYFWVIPWKIIIPLISAIIFIIALFILFLKLYKNKIVKKAIDNMGINKTRYVKKHQNSSPLLHFSLILLVLFLVIFLLVGAIYFIFFA